MMKVKIGITLSGSNGCGAFVEEDGWGSQVDIAKDDWHRDGKTICLEAADKLRELADRFQKLSETKEPFKESTQIKINQSKWKL